MKTVLTAINAKYIHSNLAVYSLKAYAVPYVNEISLAEYTINQQTDSILRDLYQRRPELLCFSCYIWNLPQTEELVREFHKLCPDVPVWIGGPEVSYDSVEVLKRLPEVTGVMKGEGEETFLELLDAYHGCGKPFSEIAGITFRDESGELKDNEWRPVMDLSKVPFVYEDMSRFEHKIIYYETSRGCPFSCSYCLSSVDKCLRFRSMDLVKKELQFFLDSKVPQVKFVDRTFNCSHERTKEIWSFLKENDNGVTNFHFEISADLLKEDELRLISDMRPGLIQLEIGVQSTNPDTIREIHRTMRFDEVADTVRKVREGRNIHQHLDLIAGLPYEDMKSFEKSFNDVYALRPDQLQLGFLKVLKGSHMETRREAYGLVYKSLPPYEVLYTRWISYEDMLSLKEVEEMVELYYNSGQFQNTLPVLEECFASPFQMYRELALYYNAGRNGQEASSRVRRYEILLGFAAEHDGGRTDMYRELLTYDLYLRENMKSRPGFAGKHLAEKEWLKEFYDTEETRRKYLTGYEQYDSRSLRKMTHIEKFIHIQRQLGYPDTQEIYILFDYQNRNPLDHQANIAKV